MIERTNQWRLMNQSEDSNQAPETVDELKEEIEKIKVMCIATHIIEIMH